MYLHIHSYAGVYNWMLTAGIHKTTDCLTLLSWGCVASSLFCANGILSTTLKQGYNGWLVNYMSPYRSVHQEWILKYIGGGGQQLNYHISTLCGVSCLAWAGHWELCSSEVTYNARLHDSLSTFIGGLQWDTASINLSDISHHHNALGLIIVMAGHCYSGWYASVGNRLRDINDTGLQITRSSLSVGNLRTAFHTMLSVSMAAIAVVTLLFAQHSYSMPPYLYLGYDYASTVAQYVHHSWIGDFLLLGSAAHATISLIRDYSGGSVSVGYITLADKMFTRTTSQDILTAVISTKGSIVSHLSWSSMWIGIHTLGCYVHNDTVVAVAEQEKQILFEPAYAHSIQQSCGKSYIYNSAHSSPVGISGADKLAMSADMGWGSYFQSLGVGDMYSHHGIAVGMHVTSLVLLKGYLDASGTSLMPDKKSHAYALACDGPGRGGSCDIGSADALYLSVFWLINTNAWVIFYYHWKHLSNWSATSLQFDESSTYLNGWFRDYLWLNSAGLISGYTNIGSNEISVWAWLFLAAHLTWATGFMFLISWRGYWQELVDIILYMHLRTPYVIDLWNCNVYTPVALSIVTARFVGLFHFTVGLIATFASFALASLN